MNSLIARKVPPACRDDERGLSERAVPPVLVAVSGLCHGLAMEPTLPPTTNPPTLDSAVDAKSGPAMLALARDVQWPGGDSDQRSGSKALASDPSLVIPVIASPEEVFRARELREQLRKQYLNRPSQPRSHWCVGVD